MNILITSGGTIEKIDDVRKIHNMATGRLGSLIADAFLEREDVTVTYICPENAVLPQNERAEVVLADDVSSVQKAIEGLLGSRTFDGIIHAMAVSDYSMKYHASSENVADFIADRLWLHRADITDKEAFVTQIHSALLAFQAEPGEKKISSDIENLFLCLEKTPKVIALFKQLQPEAVLVGFKLLVDVEEEHLIQVGKRLMEKNKCNFVLANDKKNIGEDHHIGLLIGADDSIQRLHTKQQIAEAIADSVVKKIKEKTGI